MISSLNFHHLDWRKPCIFEYVTEMIKENETPSLNQSDLFPRILAFPEVTIIFIMGEKSIELTSVTEENTETMKDAVVDTKTKELQPVPFSVIMSRFATKGEIVAMYLGYLCML